MGEHCKAMLKMQEMGSIVFDYGNNIRGQAKEYSNVKNAIRNAKYIIKKTKCDAVKLESNNNNYNVIKKLVSLGAIEVKNYDDLSADLQCLIICVTNTPVAKEIANQIASKLPSNILVLFFFFPS